MLLKGDSINNIILLFSEMHTGCGAGILSETPVLCKHSGLVTPKYCKSSSRASSSSLIVSQVGTVSLKLLLNWREIPSLAVISSKHSLDAEGSSTASLGETMKVRDVGSDRPLTRSGPYRMAESHEYFPEKITYYNSDI